MPEECCICYGQDDLILYKHCTPVYVHQNCLSMCDNSKCFVCKESLQVIVSIPHETRQSDKCCRTFCCSVILMFGGIIVFISINIGTE